MNNFLKYFIIGVAFWVVIDYTTAFNPNFQDWVNHMPLVWLFYTGYPLLFAFLFYKANWSDKKIFFAMLVAAFGLELVIFRNPLLYTFPPMLFGIPLVIFIYSFITFAPKWITEHKIKENKKKLILLVVIWIIVSILNFITKSKTI